ncbi:MAG: O-antigen ligase family protein [Deltaproteobacteria bacterium]
MPTKFVSYLDKGAEIFLYLLILGIPFSKSAVEVSILALLFCWLVKRILQKDASFPETPMTTPWLIFLFVCALSLLMTHNIELSLRALFTKYIKYFLLFIAISEFLKKNPPLLKRIGVVFLVSFALVMLDSLIQFVTGTDVAGKKLQIIYIEPKDRMRISASLSHPNCFGTYLIGAIPFLFASFVYCFKNKMKSLLCGTLVLLSLIALYFTYSRGAFIALIISVLATLLLWKKKIALIVFAASLIFVFLAPSPFTQSLRQSFNFSMNASGSIKDRLRLWKSAIDMVQERPLLGWGLNTYTEVNPLFVKDFDAWYPHNCYLQMASEIGLVGLASFLILLISFFLSFYRGFLSAKSPFEKLIAAAFLTSFLAMAFHAFVDTNFYSLPLIALFWTVCSIGHAYVTAHQKF